MSRVRQSYGMSEVRRANSMDGAIPEPMMMERLERKQFDVPEPIIIAMAGPPGAPPEVPSSEAEAAPVNTIGPGGVTPEDLEYIGVDETGLAGQAGESIERRKKMHEDLLNEI